MISLKALAVLSVPLLAGCATMAGEPMAVSHSYESGEGHYALQISMHTGVPNTPQQTVMIVYNAKSHKAGKPIAIIDGQTKTMSEELTAQLINVFGGIASGATAAAIGGGYTLMAAQANCPPGTLCGTLVQVQNQAGATAGAEADSSITN